VFAIHCRNEGATVPAKELRRYLIDECVEDFEQGRLSRRSALKLLAGLIGAAAAARMLDARAQQTAPPQAAQDTAAAAVRVAADDPAIVASAVRFPGHLVPETAGYLARPARDGKFPIVLVCHENRGLTPHIEDVTRRLAKAGYAALAVDLLSREGGTAALDPDRIPGLLGGAASSRFVWDFRMGLAHMRQQSFARVDRVGMTGFCFGGGVTWGVAAEIRDLSAAVPFYGVPVEADKVAAIQAAVLAIYAGRDERINARIPQIEEAMRERGKVFRKIVYPDVDHAFHNDTGERYNAAAAKAAWGETLA
jgi:carboxymethylenebutenolidase